MNHIKLYEEFKREIEFNSEREIELTFRFLLQPGVSPQSLKRKIKEKFIERIKPPFNFNDLTFYSFNIDHISEVPYENNRMASEYAIKAKVSVDKDAPKNSKDLDRLIKIGIVQFLKLEEDKYFQNEIDKSILVSFEYLN